MAQPSQLFQDMERLQTILICRAAPPDSDTIFDHSGYAQLRAAAMDVDRIKDFLPYFVVNCRNLDEFWAYIQPKLNSYQKRREHIRDAFSPLLLFLERDRSAPSDASNSSVLTTVDSMHVRESWSKALERRVDDPQGAITAARTLLESVCKHVLDESGEHYDAEDLPALYKKASRSINLAPSQHTEDSMKQILGGCHSVVQGVSNIRNNLSDAHGRGKNDGVPDQRHAELMINLAGAVATFLIATLEAET